VPRYDVVVVGGGSAGSAVAARLSEEPGRSVCLLEAGPDYGPFDGGGWPPDLLDARSLAFSHSWKRDDPDDRSQLRARVLGGCSAHNLCAVLRGAPADYEWGNGWGWAELEPCLERARRTLDVRPANGALSPWPEAMLAAAQELGLPRLEDPDVDPVGAAAFPANVRDGVRWNAAFAYLDEARGRPNLTVRGGSVVDRVRLDGARATGVDDVEADLVVLAAGAYGTPAILLRSGIGPADELRRHGVDVVAELPVGEGLADHVGSGVGWVAAAALDAATARFEGDHPLYNGQTFVKAASRGCPDGLWDVHVLPWVNAADEPGRYELSAGVFNVAPRSRGRLGLTARDAEAPPAVEHGLLADPADLAPVVEGLALARRLAATGAVAPLVDAETRPGEEDLETYARATARGYFHPVGTCALGAVCDARARVRGFENLVVADASLVPTLPRANTNLTAIGVAERVAELWAA
jgi:choline dehydrogenase-like flavoprotein